jgi:phosphatidate cytidylyltransferase
MSYGDDAPPSRHRSRHDEAVSEPYPRHRHEDATFTANAYADDAATYAYLAPLHDDTASLAPVDPPLDGPVDPQLGGPFDVTTSDGERIEGASTPFDPEPDEPTTSRAGRDLRAAIGVGVGLAALVLLSILFARPLFLAVLVTAVGVGTWEMVRAVRPVAHPPLLPLLAGGPIMTAIAWYGGAAALPLGLLATAIAVIVWRLGDGVAGYQRDISAAVLIAVYVPFLASFAVLLVRVPHDGDLRVLATLAGVVLSDTGGYIFGVFLGRHAMAPSVSPKKSWEGFAGSVFCAAIGSAVLLHVSFQAEYWQGALFGLAVAAAAVLGDLAESLLKRDLKIKDMSNLLPGHGGVMDRLDSILLAVPVAYAILAFVAPVGS